ncbi:MAG: hypothetical protein COA91_00350 [Robiginitomaculum sp.]|nr:MAG: hypothetical protein COA91_00350 [Robiginitomaculum sp.]
MRIISGALMATTILAIGACSTTAVNPYYQQTTKYKGSNPYADEAVVQQAGYQNQQIDTQAPAPVTYAANNQQAYRDCISKQSNRKLAGTAAGGVVGGLLGRKIGGDNKTLGTVAGAALGGAAGYGIADKTIHCDRVSTQTAITQPAQINQPIYQPVYQPVYQPDPQAVSYEAPPPAQAIQETTQSPGNAGTPGYYAVNGGAPTSDAPRPQYAQIQPSRPQAPNSAPVSTQTTYSTPTQILPQGISRHRVAPGDTLYSLARTTCSSVAEIQRLNSINQDFYIRADDDIFVPSGRCVDK